MSHSCRKGRVSSEVTACQASRALMKSFAVEVLLPQCWGHRWSPLPVYTTELQPTSKAVIAWSLSSLGLWQSTAWLDPRKNMGGGGRGECSFNFLFVCGFFFLHEEAKVYWRYKCPFRRTTKYVNNFIKAVSHPNVKVTDNQRILYQTNLL